jgi:hypothetical protein
LQNSTDSKQAKTPVNKTYANAHGTDVLFEWRFSSKPYAIFISDLLFLFDRK